MQARFQWRGMGLALALVAALTLTACGGGGGGGKKKNKNKNTPQITQVLPSTGTSGGGDTITILTMYFTDDFMVNPPTVAFGSNAALNVMGVTPNSLTCTTPPGADGTVDVTLTGTATLTDMDTLANGFTYTSNQVVSSVTPNTGDVAGGELVVITTANFTDNFTVNTPNVMFGLDAALNVVPVNASTVQAVTPLHPIAESVDVTVDGTAVLESATLVNGYTYVVTPPPQCTVTGVTPNSGDPAGGNAVFIQGTDFDVPPISIEFGAGNFAQILQQPSSSVIQVLVPAGPAGTVDVTVNNATLSCTLTNGYTYNTPPPPVCNITSISPAQGSTNGGNPATITGTGFDAIPTNNTVTVDGNPATVTGGTTTSLDIVVPAGNAGAVDVVVDVNGAFNCTAAGGYTYIGCAGGPGCNITSIVPNQTFVGDTITINGTSFEMGAQVYFDASPSPMVDDSQAASGVLTVEVPAPSGGAIADVQVVNPSGACCTDNNAFTFIGCTLSSVTPNTGPGSGGQNITIAGQFDPGPNPIVMFGGNQANVAANDAVSILVQSPPGVGGSTVDVTVLDAAGDFCVLANGYTYTGCGATGMPPTADGTNGGEFFTITGGPFDPSLFVTFGTIFADPNLMTVDPSGTAIYGVVPPSPVGGTVIVTVDNIISRTQCTIPFDYVLPGGSTCSVSAVMPAMGDMGGGTMVTITGSGFDANTGVIFDVVPATQVNFVDANTITAVTPPYAGALQQQVLVDVWVCPEFSNPCLLSLGYTYEQASCPGACTVTSVTPNVGSTAGGDMVTINGTGFCASNPQVLFDGVPATNVVYVSDTQMTCTTPPGSGGVTVGYTDGGGCIAICTPACFTYQ